MKYKDIQELMENNFELKDDEKVQIDATLKLFLIRMALFEKGLFWNQRQWGLKIEDILIKSCEMINLFESRLLVMPRNLEPKVSFEFYNQIEDLIKQIDDFDGRTPSHLVHGMAERDIQRMLTQCKQYAYRKAVIDYIYTLPYVKNDELSTFNHTIYFDESEI